MRRFRKLALALCLAAVSAGSVAAEPPLWRVQGPRGSAVLFGSIHLLPPGLAWKTAALTEALANADELWFEIPIGEAADARAAKFLVARGRLQGGDTLEAHLPADLAARVDREAAALGVAPAALAVMRPWLADATLSLASDIRSGASASQGVERQIAIWTPASVKRRALETAENQVAILAGGAPEEQVRLLRATLDEIENHPDRYRAIVTAWMSGDITRLQAEALAPLATASPRAYRALIVDRNRAWMRAIVHRLHRKGAIVVVVGVGHLIGAESLPALLASAGEGVDPPPPNKPNALSFD